MSYMRFTLDLAIPKTTYDAIPDTTKLAFRNRVRAMRALAKKINEGQPNEENTLRAVWHICHHDDPNAPSCEPEQEV